MIKSSKAHDAALKLVNEIALVDLDMAAKIKPSIDMFVESLENTLTNNELFNDLTEFFKLTDDNAKKQWLTQHKDIATKINEIFDSMNEAEPKPLTEVKELKDGIPTSDVPIKPDEETEISAKIPEDGFNEGDDITMPLAIKGDDEKLMGKKDFPTVAQMDPNNTPKVIDGNEGQVEELKIPKNNLSTTIESIATKFYKQAVLESIKKVLSRKTIKESNEDKYVEFLDQFALDRATTELENNPMHPRFTQLRTFAKALYKQFQDDFASFDEALKVVTEWYKYQGRANRIAKKEIPARIFIEMRGNPDGFNVNLYLVKPNDIGHEDLELASDLYETYTGEYSDDVVDFWKESGKTESGNNIWKMTIPFPRGKKTSVPLSRIKNDIVDFIHREYKNKYEPTTKIPGWIFDYVSVTSESLNETSKYPFVKSDILDEDGEEVLFDVFQEIFDEYINRESVVDGIDFDDATDYVMEKFVNDFEDYYVPEDMVEDITSLDIEDVENYLNAFIQEKRKELEV